MEIKTEGKIITEIWLKNPMKLQIFLKQRLMHAGIHEKIREVRQEKIQEITKKNLISALDKRC